MRGRLAALAGGLVLAGVAVALWWLAPHAPRRTRPPAHPHLVLITVDTLRADHLGSYGYPVDASPHLDALAAEGVRFSRFEAACSWTRPAMGAMLTGQYARSLGLYEERFDTLPRDAFTLAERLHRAGYLTLGVTANPNINAMFGFDQGFDAYGDSTVVFQFMPTVEGQRAFDRNTTPLEGARQVTDRALAMVDERAFTGTQPIYLQVLYIDPHVPTEPPDEHLAAVGGGLDRISMYDGEIHYVDAEIRRLLDGLQARGILQDALVVVTSDHGEGLLDHPTLPLGGGHGDILYESVTHVPLLLVGLDLPAGRVVDDLVSQIDLMPTLLELLGLGPAPADVAGTSLASLVRGTGAVPRLPEEVFFETAWRYTDKVGVRTARHKYLRNDDARAYQEDGTHEQRTLTEMEQQMLERWPPEEFFGYVAGPDNPDIALERIPGQPEHEALLAAIRRWEKQTPRRMPLDRDPDDVIVRGDGTVVHTGGAPGAGIDEQTRIQLEAMGYLAP